MTGRLGCDWHRDAGLNQRSDETAAQIVNVKFVRSGRLFHPFELVFEIFNVSTLRTGIRREHPLTRAAFHLSLLPRFEERDGLGRERNRGGLPVLVLLAGDYPNLHGEFDFIPLGGIQIAFPYASRE